MLDFLSKAERSLPTLAGVKYAAASLAEYGTCVQSFGDRFSMMVGMDDMLVPALAAGAKSTVGATFNQLAPLFTKLWKAFNDGDLATARKLQLQVARFISVCSKYGGLSANKTSMKFLGIDCGPTRLPLKQVTPEMEAALRRDLEETGFFDWRSSG